MLWWHKEIWLIDHGAAIFYQHNRERFAQNAANPFPQIKDHILLPFADEIEAADAKAAKLTPEILRGIVDLIPAEWLTAADLPREIYFDFFAERLQAREKFVKEAIDARRLLHV